MINRELTTVVVISYQSGTDNYGQTKITETSRRNVEMVVHMYSEQNVNNPLYDNVVYTCLTYDNSITDENKIEVNGVVYNVKYIIPGRLNQILLSK